MATRDTVPDEVALEAALWAARTGDPAFAEWEAFTVWLEADPAHSQAYDRVITAVEEAVEGGIPGAPAAPEFGDTVVPLRPSRRRWIGGAIAACAAAALAVGTWQLRPQAEVYRTAPGEIREIALSDGSTVTMAGATRLKVMPGDHEVELVLGQALFEIRHDEARPFKVLAGADTLLDVGTVFDVRKDGSSLTVAVAEGAVIFNPEAEAVRIDPGRRLESGQGAVRVADTPPALIGEWREGRLTFDNVALDRVAADITRATGVTFHVARDDSGKRVSGSLLVEPIRLDPASLGPLLGVRVNASGKDWIIEP